MSFGRVQWLWLVAAAAALALGGCQTLGARKPAPPAPPPRPEPPPPPILVMPKREAPPALPPPPPPRSCVPRNLGAAPRYPDSDAALRAAPGAADRYQLMAAGRILRQQRLEELEKVIAGCR